MMFMNKLRALVIRGREGKKKKKEGGKKM